MNAMLKTAVSPAMQDRPFDRATWLAIRAAWKEAARARKTTASQHAAYALLRGASIDRAFTPISRPGKIVGNGNNPHAGRDAALQAATSLVASAWAPWAGLLKDVARNRGGWAYEGSHALFDVALAEASRQGF